MEKYVLAAFIALSLSTPVFAQSQKLTLADLQSSSDTIEISKAKSVTVSGGSLTKEDLQALQKTLVDRNSAQAAKLHPIRHKILKCMGYYWMDNHVLMPVNNWCTEHSGLVNLGGAAAGYATTAMVGAKGL